MSNGQTFIVDAYNVIHQSPPMRACLRRSKETARDSLIAFCIEWRSRRRDADAFWVVFDGDPTISAASSARAIPRHVHVVYAASGEKADGRILEMLDASPAPGRCVVVTADRRVAEGATLRGAHVWTPAQFLGLLRSPPRTAAGDFSGDNKNGLSGREQKQINDEMKRVFGVE